MENNGGLWWLMVAVGDGESAWDVRNGFGRKKEEEMVFFLSYTKAKAENAQVRNGLGHGNAAHTPDIFSKIPMVRSWTSVL